MKQEKPVPLLGRPRSDVFAGISGKGRRALILVDVDEAGERFEELIELAYPQAWSLAGAFPYPALGGVECLDRGGKNRKRQCNMAQRTGSAADRLPSQRPGGGTIAGHEDKLARANRSRDFAGALPSPSPACPGAFFENAANRS